MPSIVFCRLGSTVPPPMFFTKILRLLTLNNCQGWWLEPPKLPSLSVCFLFLFPVSLWKELSFFSCFFSIQLLVFQQSSQKRRGFVLQGSKKNTFTFSPSDICMVADLIASRPFCYLLLLLSLGADQDMDLPCDWAL